MDTNKIRQLSDAACEVRYSVQTTLHLALAEIADALDELDERTRGEGEPEPGTDTCDCGICSERRLAGASTIPGCHCRECRYSKWAPEYKCWSCIHAGSPAFAVVSVPVGFGCTLGERREAEDV